MFQNDFLSNTKTIIHIVKVAILLYYFDYEEFSPLILQEQEDNPPYFQVSIIKEITQ